MANQRFCPVCHERPVEHQAMMPLLVLGGTILPDAYSVCGPCELAQREEYYRLYPPPVSTVADIYAVPAGHKAGSVEATGPV